MIIEIAALLGAAGAATGGSLFASRWIDRVDESLKELQSGQNHLKDEVAEIKARMPNGQLKEAIEILRELKSR